MEINLANRSMDLVSIRFDPFQNDLVALAQPVIGAVMDEARHFDRWEIGASYRWWALILFVDRNAGFGIHVLIFVFVVMPDSEAGTSRCRAREIAEKLPEKLAQSREVSDLQHDGLLRPPATGESSITIRFFCEASAMAVLRTDELHAGWECQSFN